MAAYDKNGKPDKSAVQLHTVWLTERAQDMQRLGKLKEWLDGVVLLDPPWRAEIAKQIVSDMVVKKLRK